MNIRRWGITNFAAVVAVLGLLAMIGIWDNQRTIRRNLDAGYDTSAMITGANETHRSPLAFDGLRPRFVDEIYSLDLAWRGRDGTQRTCEKVPVSHEYMASLMDGDKVRLVPVPIKVMDEQGAVPTIVSDATARLKHLNGFATFTAYGVAVAIFIFGISFGVGRWRSDHRVATLVGLAPVPKAWYIPPRLAVLTVFCLGTAAMFGYYSLKDSWDAEATRAHGRDTTATITGFHATLGAGHRISYAIDLTWRDQSGADRHFGPTHISDAFAQQIAADRVLIIRQTAIRYLEENQSARPIIVADADEQTRQSKIGHATMAVFGAAGIVLAGITALRTRRT
jgi:hypothetical protein